ncbi:MAG TPA: tetratricopeptide repeat protein [Steroidobacteraceae bacterium]|nr:tetratricopeptide repeat protein [Steroidobacteraceae bacterium]
MQQGTSASAAPGPAGFRLDDLIIDLGRLRVTRAGAEIPLSQLSFDLLVALASSAPNVVSFDQLMERVWPGLVVSQETVSQRIKLVRDALGDDPHSPRYIAGVRGRGYRMLGPITALTTLPSATVPTASATEVHATAGQNSLVENTESAPQNAPAATVRETVIPANDSSLEAPARESVAHAGNGGVFARSRRHLAAALGLATLIAVAWIVGTHRIPSLVQRSDSSEPSVIVQPPKTIAVLPLIDLSPGRGNEYVGDGLAQELSSRLARIPGLRIASRTSAFAFKGRNADIRTIAQSLGVRHVLEGSVRRDGDRLRVTAQLTDAGTGYHVWSQSYDRTWHDILTIEDELARAIVDALQVVLSSEVARRFNRPPTTHVQAFDLYLSGLAKLRQPLNATQLADAESNFKEALADDPKFALAYAGLCESYTIGYDRTHDTAVAQKAEVACHQALALDASLLDVDTALADLYLQSGRSTQAAVIFRNALDRDPTNADSYIGLARAYEGQQQTAQADETYQRAVDVEPGYWAAHSAYGRFLFQHGRAEAAAAQYRRVTELTPASASGFSNLGAALQMNGDFTGAARAFEQSLALEPSSNAYSNTGTMYYFLGRFTDSVQMFRKAAAMEVDDHRVWGNLADALYQLPGARPQAADGYRKAVQLAERELGVNPNDATDWAQLAYYYSRLGDTSHARQYSERALKLGTDVVYVHYYRALIAMSGGDTSAALDALTRAVDLGFPRQLVRAAPEFASLHGDERFRRLLAGAGPSS